MFTKRSLILKLCVLLYFKCVKVCSEEITEAYNDTVITRSKDKPHTGYHEFEIEEVDNIHNSSEDGMEFLPDLNLNVISAAVKALPDNMCRRQSYEVIRSVIRREPWAMQMLDSSPKFPVGILYGSVYQLGNFDECIESEYNDDERKWNLSSNKILGQYCLADISTTDNSGSSKISRATFNKTLRWAICVPSSCTVKDIATFFKEIFRITRNENKINVAVESTNCYFRQHKRFTTAELVYGLVILMFLLVTGTATVYHLVVLYRKGKYYVYSIDENTKSSYGSYKFLLSFSLIRNTSKILKIKENNNHIFGCIAGLKCLCMLLIIPGHSLLFITSGPVMNTAFYDKAITKVENGLFLNNPLLVDTFLFLSGFLLCRLLIWEFDRRNGNVNFLILYICRYVRLTPSYLVVIGLYCTFLRRMDNGPLWNSVILTEQERCLKSWWTNILYVNNYVNTNYLCMFQSWYLAADTQLFFVAPFIIYPLWRYKIFGKVLLSAVTVAAVVVPGIETYTNRLDPTFMIYPSEVKDLNNNFYFKNVYIKTHTRASSYCIGLIFGYVMYKLQTTSLKIPTYVNLFGWCTSVLCAAASMFSVSVFYQPGHEYNLIEATIYATCHRIAWCIAFGWIIVACVTGNGGLINKFLSWKIFMPLSRLTYCAYLVNGLIELHALGTLRFPRYMSIYNLGSLITSHLVLTFIAAFALCVLFESPIHNLEKILLEQDRKVKTTICNNNTRSIPKI